ncbi:uncharacterized protein VP01_6674g1, partial [Puccinia sorghi]
PQRKLDHQLGIRLHPSTPFHHQTDGHSEIANEAIKQYLPHFISYHQDDWDQLLSFPRTTMTTPPQASHLSKGIMDSTFLTVVCVGITLHISYFS